MATRVGSERIRVRLLVGRTPVELDAPADATVATAAEALAAALDASPDGLALVRTAAPLPPDAPLGSVGLRHGDRLVLGGPPPEPPADTGAALELAVVGGADAGRTFPLLAGEHVVGRDPDCAVPLADAALSGRHLRLAVDAAGAVVAEDLGSRNGTAVEGSSLEPGKPEPLPPGAVLRAGRTLLAVRHVASSPVRAGAAADGTVPFNRPPRVRRPLEPALRPFPAPPDVPQRGRLPLGASLLPLALGLGLFLAFHMPTMLFFSLLAPLMAASTYLEDRRSGRKGYQQRRREYRARLAALKEELERERARELAARRASAPDAAELLRRVRTLDPELWERRPADPDFLSLRLGSADLPALLSVKLEQGGDAALRAEVEQLAGWYAVAPGVPLEAPLGELGLLGLCGAPERVEGLARWLVAEAAALHSPRELAIAAAVADERAAAWEWAMWLPHVGSGTLRRGVVTGPLAARALVEDVGRLVAERRQAAGEAFGAGRRAGWTQILLVLDETVAPERPLVAQALAGAAEVGVAVVWLGAERRDLPGECAAIVELDHAAARLSYTDARNGSVVEDVTADELAPELAEELALTLAPVRDTSTGRGSTAVPDSVPLLDLLGLPEPSPAAVAARWDAARDGLAAVIGAGADGPVAVDLRADGPHALVAGMTGAGKSELLRTLIASLAAAHPPTRLTFLLVDYKGGAAFKECAELPHTVGVVTDLDAHLTERALVSLNAELRRREAILRDAGANDLAELERRDPERAPASLAIVVDEFATLAKEVPEFIEGIVDVAQRGRSLGVHLVLATQRPGGVVSENIRANTNLRIALRVNEAAESADVIGVGDAARIPRDRPGRAYVRTGHGELEEVQTGYVGGATATGADDRSLRVRVLALDGADARADDGLAADAETDLRRLVGAAAGAAEERALPLPVSPWLPPLPAVLPLEQLEPSDDASTRAAVGLLDEPAEQRQEPFAVDLEAEGSLIVYGTSGSGKTTFLRTLALSLARVSSPDELHVYGLDFATRGLGILEQLPHCGAVIAGEDEERTARLFALLRATLERRKALFAERGVFNVSEFRRRCPDEPLPRILVLLDGYGGFASAFERVNLGALVDALPRLVADGRPLGVHFAISGDRRGALPSSLAGLIPAKVVLRMADEDEATSLGVPRRALRGAALPPGRGFLSNGIELQVALVGGDPSGEAQAAAVGELAQHLRNAHGPGAVPPIEPLPVRVARGELPVAATPLHAVLGIADSSLAPAELDLSDRHFLVSGPYRSGRSTALETVVRSLGGAELHLLAPRRTPLTALGGWTSVAEGAEAVEAAALRLAELVETRPEGAAAPLVVVIDDGEELADALCAPALETIVRRGRDRNVRVVAAAERQAVQRAFGGWLRELRKEEHGLLLDPDPDVDGDLLGVRLPRRSNPVSPPGRGYLVVRGVVELVQVAAA